MDKALQALNIFWGYNEFRQGQREIIENILNNKDTFGIMPTGGGKSICYQIPALIKDGLTLVISPLISLMKDQVDNLNNMGIKAAYINKAMDKKEIENIIFRCSIKEIKILYIAPERLEINNFCESLKRSIEISFIAVDEAHCVSAWGHDFRKSYLFIRKFIDSLNKRPVIAAFTATANKAVREDVVKLLGLENPYNYIGSFNRANLKIYVHKDIEKLEFVKDFIRENEDESGIIYCATRKDVDNLYEYLRERGVYVAKYHGGMEEEQRNRFQEEFLFEKYNVMVATNAFGMGIDKSNIRYIIHFTMPKNLESYYQEIGRGGRDGLSCQCHLLYSTDDIRLQEYIINTSTSFDRRVIELQKLNDMINFCNSNDCFKTFILKYFGENNVSEFCGACSNCFKNTKYKDLTKESQMILSCIYRTKEMVGISVLTDILRGVPGPKIKGNGYINLSTYGIMKNYSGTFIKNMVEKLILESYLDRKEGTYSMVKLNQKSIDILKGNIAVFLELEVKDEDYIEDEDLFKKLRILRKDISSMEGMKPYLIFTDATLIQIANNKPKTLEEFKNISGMGENKIRKYGEYLLKVINN